MSSMMKQLCWHLKLYLKHQNLHEKGFLSIRSVSLRHKPENGTLHRRLTFWRIKFNHHIGQLEVFTMASQWTQKKKKIEVILTKCYKGWWYRVRAWEPKEENSRRRGTIWPNYMSDNWGTQRKCGPGDY